MAAKSISIPVVTSPPVRVSFVYAVDPTFHRDSPDKLYFTVTLMCCKTNAEQMAWLKVFA